MDWFLPSDCAPEKDIGYLYLHNHYEQDKEGHGTQTLTVIVQTILGTLEGWTWPHRIWWCWDVERPKQGEVCEFGSCHILLEMKNGRKTPSPIWDKIENYILYQICSARRKLQNKKLSAGVCILFLMQTFKKPQYFKIVTYTVASVLVIGTLWVHTFCCNVILALYENPRPLIQNNYLTLLNGSCQSCY